jgi:hypothetical protein
VELAAVAKLQGITLEWFTESGRAALVVLGNHPINSYIDQPSDDGKAGV